MTESQFKLGVVQRCTDLFWKHKIIKFPKPIKTEKHLFECLDQLLKIDNKYVIKINSQIIKLKKQKIALMTEYSKGSIAYRRNFYPRLTMRLNKIKDKTEMLKSLLK